MSRFYSAGLATVQAVNMTKEGLFVDLLCQPVGEEISARVLRPDSGPGYGFHAPLAIDDTVLYLCPGDDPGDGVYIVGTFHEQAEPSPQFAQDDPESRGWRTKEGSQLRLEANGAQITLQTDGNGGDILLRLAGTSGFVNLGSEQAQDFVIKGTTYRTAETTRDNVVLALLSAHLPFLSLALPLPPVPPPAPAAALAQATAFAALYPGIYNALQYLIAKTSGEISAINAFAGGSATYLSQKVRTI